jgi:hypothetical protein
VKQLRELSIMTPNRPGILAKVLKALAAANVNLQAVDSSSGFDLNLVRMVTSDVSRARKALTKLGYHVMEAEVLVVTVLDQPGQLVKAAAALGKAKVNIEYLYATAAVPGAEALAVFHLSDLEAGERALRDAGLL